MNILKLYKVIASDEAGSFDKDFIRKLLISYGSAWADEPVNYIEVNYSGRKWKRQIVFFSICPARAGRLFI